MVRGNDEEKPGTTTAAALPQSSSSSIVKKIEEEEESNSNRQNEEQTAAESTLSADDIAGAWSNLPSVILLEVFSYLPHDSRIQASQVCRNWRYTLFHPSFWKKITFTLVDNDSVSWSRCLSSWFKYSVQEVTICCDPANNFVKEALYILKKLSGNRQLRRIFLEPSKCLFENPNHEVNSDKFLKEILNILETSNSLEAISLGCAEELTEDLTTILESLRLNHAKRLKHLSLASVKDDPDHYDFLELEGSLFNDFSRLTMLTIDYDHLSDELLQALNSGVMERLVIHVHGWNREYVGASNAAWATFTQRNPRCELRLSLIHSYNAVRVLDTEILESAMPLTHLKVLFCERMNFLALQQISHWYAETLQSIIWIDSFNSQKNFEEYEFDDANPDPLILAAWRCKNLSEIVFIGQKYFLDYVLAIARLRHTTLKRLEFAETNISCDDCWSDRESMIDEVREKMGKQWKLLTDEELPKVVLNSEEGDSREVIMPMVLRDQK